MYLRYEGLKWVLDLAKAGFYFCINGLNKLRF